MPSKPSTGVNVTLASESRVNVPSPGTVMLSCICGMLGLRSMVLVSTLTSLLVILNVTGVLGVVVTVSLVKVGVGATFTEISAGGKELPSVSSTT